MRKTLIVRDLCRIETIKRRAAKRYQACRLDVLVAHSRANLGRTDTTAASNMLARAFGGNWCGGLQ